VRKAARSFPPLSTKAKIRGILIELSRESSLDSMTGRLQAIYLVALEESLKARAEAVRLVMVMVARHSRRWFPNFAAIPSGISFSRTATLDR